MKLTKKIRDFIMREPSPHYEFVAGQSAMLWALFLFLSDDYHMVGCDYVVPWVSLAVGFVRWGLLARDPLWRVGGAAIGIGWSTYLLVHLFWHYGFVASEAWLIAMLTGDFLTSARFSLIAKELDAKN